VGPETGDARGFTTYAQLLAAYAAQVRFAVTNFNASVSAIERGHQLLRPIPFQSAITDNAMDAGLDLTNGGSKYYTAGIEGVGMADVADSLTAIKKLVYDDQKVTMAQVLDALAANFDNQEPLRQVLLTRAPKFGNDDDYADDIARESCTVFLKEVKHHTDHWGSDYYPGIWSIYMAVELGVMVGALPNGRKSGESLTEGVAPSRGCDLLGPTAAVNSVAKLDHHLMGNGSIFNLKFNPVMFQENNLDHFITIQKTFFKKGGFQMQVAVVDGDTLREAQANPDEHRNLVVRVAGYCAQFIELGPRMQEHIIQRTEHI
jgi:formate C-acetyltransferase